MDILPDDGLQQDQDTGRSFFGFKIRGKQPQHTLKGEDTRRQERKNVDLLAAELGLSRKDAGKKIHEAKDAGGLGGQDNLKVGKGGTLSRKGEDLTSD